MSKFPQIYCRQPKSVELIEAEPVFKPVSAFVKPDTEVRCSAYSPSGDSFVYSQQACLVVCDPSTGENLFTIDVPNVLDFQFSSKGHYLTSWSRPTKLDDDSGNWKDNVEIYRLDLAGRKYEVVQTYLNKMQSGWKPQFTADESIFCRLVNPSQISFYSQEDTKKSLYSLNLKDAGKIQTFELSPGKNPSVAVFIPGNRGNPAFIRIYSLPNLKTPSSQKQFFKGETCKFQWNDLGTSILALVSTDVDSTNKSYYGESQLYLFGITGAFDQKINLDKEGPIHDITWSPTSREFAVIYGYMPSNTTFFDSRGNEIHSLAQGPRNTILYSPHAKYILVAGFGNLQGNVEILDRQNRFNKVASFQASNTSVCKWSPDGRFILTATTSPRLRVDNCVKIWYFNGTLCFIKDFTELYGVGWRYQPLSDFPPISTSKPDKCEITPDVSAIEYMAKKTSISGTQKSGGGGAYRPPHARNRGATPSRTLAEVEAQRMGRGGSRSSIIPGSANSSTESFVNRRIPGTVPARIVPGAMPVDKKVKKKKRHHRKENEDATDSANSDNGEDNGNESLIVGGVFSLEEKKIRNLLKKLRSIQKLKVKQTNGDFLEKTQVLKIQTESQVRKELESLGWKEGQSETGNNNKD
ncbi:DEKNAAC102696 [Brettanomyces naardenensis]|uniref:Eukaryotic translation initiation factor 2A n=1 Tax=Brettanomyces naardenensis TaxID=13370 RepID=A0A448YKC3_BRENA|nr:DEKNAAC102696 [Brettanomyces naardenensis]